MVKIINGEIVQDNDPRLKNLHSTASRGSSTSSGRGGFQDMSSMRARQQQQQPPSSSFRQGGQQQAQAGGGGQPAAPLDGIANAMGISDKAITIPAIPPLGMSSTRIGLIYFVLLGVMYMLFDSRALLFAVVVY